MNSWSFDEQGNEGRERSLFERRARVIGAAGVPSLASVLRAAAVDVDASTGTRWATSGRVRAIAGALVAAACVAVAFGNPAGRTARPSGPAVADTEISADEQSTLASQPQLLSTQRPDVRPSQARQPTARLDSRSGDGPGANDIVHAVPVDGAPSRGSARASITIVEFADFQCAFCARAEVTLRALELTHPGDVRVVFKNLPLPIHGDARLAAKAALAADAQGRFWDFHDRLYAQSTGALDRMMLTRIAADLRLDVERFSRDLGDSALDGRIAKDETDAAALGVAGTPTFFVNGYRIDGALPIATFEAVIAKASRR
jgi:protein-disulfide isomerase